MINKYTNTGNSVANYTEETKKCSACNGQGMEKVSWDELGEIMAHVSIERAIHLYKQWRFEDECIDCKDCDGLGEITYRY